MVETFKRVLSTIKDSHYSEEDIKILEFLQNFIRAELQELRKNKNYNEDLDRELYFLLVDVQCHLVGAYNK